MCKTFKQNVEKSAMFLFIKFCICVHSFSKKVTCKKLKNLSQCVCTGVRIHNIARLKQVLKNDKSFAQSLHQLTSAKLPLNITDEYSRKVVLNSVLILVFLQKNPSYQIQFGLKKIGNSFNKFFIYILHEVVDSRFFEVQRIQHTLFKKGL